MYMYVHKIHEPVCLNLPPRQGFCFGRQVLDALRSVLVPCIVQDHGSVARGVQNATVASVCHQIHPFAKIAKRIARAGSAN